MTDLLGGSRHDLVIAALTARSVSLLLFFVAGADEARHFVQCREQWNASSPVRSAVAWVVRRDLQFPTGRREGCSAAPEIDGMWQPMERWPTESRPAEHRTSTGTEGRTTVPNVLLSSRYRPGHSAPRLATAQPVPPCHLPQSNGPPEMNGLCIVAIAASLRPQIHFAMTSTRLVTIAFSSPIGALFSLDRELLSFGQLPTNVSVGEEFH